MRNNKSQTRFFGVVLILVFSLVGVLALSNVILINDALHLDEGKNFVEGIYESVATRDGIWSERVFLGLRGMSLAR